MNVKSDSSNMVCSVDLLPAGAFPPMASNWCHSVCDVVKVDFEWVIHHFELQKRDRKGNFQSTLFSPECDDKPDFTWDLFIDNSGIIIKPVMVL